MPLTVDPQQLLAAFPAGSWIEDGEGIVLAGIKRARPTIAHPLGSARVFVPQELDLRNRQELYRTFIERSNEGIWRFEVVPPIPVDLPIETQIDLAFERAVLAEGNDALARMYGAERAQDIIGLPLSAMMAPDDPANVAYLTAFIENGYILENGESEETALDGSRRTFVNNLIGMIEDEHLTRAWGVQRDVTEERRKERLFRKIADATPDLLYLYDTWTERVEFVNERVQDILGWTSEEFISGTEGQEPSFVHPEDRPLSRSRRWSDQRFGPHEIRQSTFRFRHKNGGYRALELRIMPFETAQNGSPLRLLAIGRDLSALRSQGRDFAQVIEGMDHLVWSTLADGYHDYFNARWKEYVGFQPKTGEIEDMWSQLLHPDDLRRTAGVWTRALKTGAPYEVEYRIRRHDGAYRWFLGRALPIRDDDGHIVRWFGTCTDIHAQRVAIESVARESGRLRLALETLGAGAWRFDLATGAVEWSGEMYSLQGVEPGTEDLYAASLEHMNPEDRERFKGLMRACSRGLRSFQQDIRTHSPEKGERWMRVRAMVVDDAEGQPESVVGLVQDVTNDKRNEEALERAVAERTRELQLANTELEGFTYSVSHDLRAPLRAIVANSRILLDDAPPELSEEHRSMLVRQAVNAKRLGDLIDDLLRLSRISRQEMRIESLDMTAMAKEVASEIETRVPGKVSFEVGEGMRSQGDPRLLRFVWLNLLENAVKFSPTGGTVEIGKDEEGFFVRDQGIGFDTQYAHKLFQPFERLVRDEQFPGTGIGLANVKRIVERHRGEVSAEGKPGEGATFRFRLPEKA
ncbi:PAS domain S-box protein [soil metagenome]